MTSLGLLLSCCLAADTPQAWTRLPSLPDPEGFAGMFAGTSGGALLAAGGSNFPGKKPWEGGRKVWIDTVYVLEKPDGEWKVAGMLPRKLGYGVSVSHSSGVVCVGGSDAERHYVDAFRLEWKNGKLITSKLPSLPQPVANACGTLLGDVLYLAGGSAKPDAVETLKTVYRLDLATAEPKWEAVDGIPGGGRMLSVAAATGGKFWLVGGVDLAAGADAKPVRRYLKEVFSYEPAKGWKREADLPHTVVAAPTPAPADAAGFEILGGDDGSQVKAAPAEHRGFSKTILRYDLAAGKWLDAGDLPAPRVTTAAVFWNQSWVVPSGESRPGVRSPEVWSRAIAKKE